MKFNDINENNYAEGFGGLSLYQTDSIENIISQTKLNITIRDVIYNPNIISDKLADKILVEIGAK